MRVMQNRAFWVSIVLFVFVSVIHYDEVIGIPHILTPSFHYLGLTRHALDRILFLVPVIHAAFLFKRKGALITSSAALSVMLPRAILISPVPGDAIMETVGILGIGALASWGIWTRAEERDKTELALAKLKSAHEILQHYAQSAEENERRQTILNTISTLLGESLELKRILGKAIRMVSELMEAEVSLIFSLDEESEKLKLVAYEGVSDEFARAVDGIKVGEGFYGGVAKIHQPMIVDNASDDPRMRLPETSKMQIQAQLIVPMILRGQIRGVLCVAMRRPRHFSLEDMELLTSVGAQIATAMENASLYEKERLAAQRLSISERNYRQLFENASDAIWVHDMEGDITAANEAAGKLLGYSVEELKKMNVMRFLSGESLSLSGQIRRKLLEKEPVEQPYEQRLIRKDGTEAILLLSTNLVTESGKPVGFQHIARDITEQRKAEEMLAKTIDGSPMPCFAINKEHKVTHWNTALESLSGIKREEVVRTDKQWVAFSAEKRPVMADLIVDGASSDEIGRYYQGKSKKSDLIDGAYEAEGFYPTLGEGGRWLHFMASPIRGDRGEIIGAIETLRDITEGRRMQDSLRYYLSQISKVQEEERKRIARDLHDDTSQALYALSRQLDNFTRNNTKLAANTASFLEGLREQLNRALEGIRRFTQELRPPMLDDLGLLATLRWGVGELEKRSGMKAELRVVGDERRFSAEVELLTFRIVQEALRNDEKHAHASEVEVKVEFGKGKTKVSIGDNGKGFNLRGSLADLPRAGKLGLAGMEERVRLLNGSMKIESKPGKGTRVAVELPV
ncbi:MAG: PAS domain S-box protein [Dehalococcoidia bacterium]|nr:MAG: PAS domain S-box protein [Dehalococcoidia bacterium]